MQQAALYALLDELNISFLKVDHPAFGSISDYHQHGIEFPGQCVKNLFLKNRKGNRFYLLVLPELKTADLAQLAQQLDEARLSFASEASLLELMALTPGSVTPFGLINDAQQRIALLLDSSLDPEQSIGFHPMENSATVCISFADFLRFIEHTGHSVRQVAL